MISDSEAKRLRAVRARLVRAMHSADTLVLLRERVIEVISDMPESRAAHSAAPTLRSVPEPESIPSTDVEVTPDSAPPVDVDSDLGREYGGS